MKFRWLSTFSVFEYLHVILQTAPSLDKSRHSIEPGKYTTYPLSGILSIYRVIQENCTLSMFPVFLPKPQCNFYIKRFSNYRQPMDMNIYEVFSENEQDTFEVTSRLELYVFYISNLALVPTLSFGRLHSTPWSTSLQMHTDSADIQSLAM